MTLGKTGTTKFLKPDVPNSSLLGNTPGDPEGYVTKDGMFAAVPCGKVFIIIHNGKQVHQCKTYKQSLAYIKKLVKINKKTNSPLEKIL